LLALGGLLVWSLAAPGPQERQPASTGAVFQDSREVQGVTLALTMDPARAGESVYRVTVTGRDRAPVRDAREVLLTLQFLEHASGAPLLHALPQPDGSYQVGANSIAVPGRWQIGAEVQGGTANGAAASFVALIGPRQLPAQEPAGLLPYRIDLRNFGLRTVTALELSLGGAAMLLMAAWFVRNRSQRRTGMLLGAGGIVVGLYMAGTSVVTPLAPSELFRNPSPGDPASVARGRPVFQANCATCHGPAGRGDGPNARGLNPPPADLAAGHLLSHTDEDLFQWVTGGIDGTAMPAFKDKLTAEQRWDAVNFLRTLTFVTQ
jgi:mono/diheme cytochrome c family protein